MKIHYIPFDNSYRAAYRQVSRAVRYNNYIFTCGQLDADGEGLAQHIDDLTAQTRRSIWLVKDVIRQSGGNPEDILQLQIFYKDSRHVTVGQFKSLVNSLLPKSQPVIQYIPLENFPKGVEIEIDAVANIGSKDSGIEKATVGQVQALRCNEMVFANATLDNIEPEAVDNLLAELESATVKVGAKIQDYCRLRYYEYGLPDAPSITERHLARQLMATPMVCTRLPLNIGQPSSPHAQIEFSGNLSITTKTPMQRHDPWDLGYHSAISCPPFLYFGGQLPSDECRNTTSRNIENQITDVMLRLKKQLGDFNISFADVLKINAYYAGSHDLNSWTKHVQQRCNFYPQPGPASTGVEVTTVGLKHAMVTVDCTAIL